MFGDLSGFGVGNCYLSSLWIVELLTENLFVNFSFRRFGDKLSAWSAHNAQIPERSNLLDLPVAFQEIFPKTYQLAEFSPTTYATYLET